MQNGPYYHGYVAEEPGSTTTCLGRLQGILKVSGRAYEIMPESTTSTYKYLHYKLNSEESDSFPMRCELTKEGLAREVFSTTEPSPLM